MVMEMEMATEMNRGPRQKIFEREADLNTSRRYVTTEKRS